MTERALDPNNPRNPRRLQHAQRVEQATALRIAGHGFQRIADALGVAVSTAWKLVDEGLASAKAEAVRKGEELRSLELERVDALWSVAYAAAIGNPRAGIPPSLRAMDRCVRLLERRAALLGVDAPKRTDVTTAGEPLSGDNYLDVLVLHGDDGNGGGAKG